LFAITVIFGGQSMLKPVNPAAIPPNPMLSQGVEATGIGRMLFVSGQVGVTTTGEVPEGIGAQTQAAIANVNAVLAEAGMDASNIAKMTIYLTDETSIPGFVEAAAGALPAPPPATSLLIIKGLAGPGLLIEIEAIAVK
jgi:2-iminobutanoate/2-iminopropanoate deaminase